ncbi:M20 metallopeptidase family protein [Savagea faecisuis]|uniref:M20 family metallopeptidase n=1 Tax=Savagea faecisuis TaxID=1274803 RepID=A0ABW3GV28_9BACL
MKLNVKACAQQLQSQLVEWRRHFHQHPELSFEEWETSKYIQTILKQYDVEVIPNIAKTGLKVIKRGKRPGPTLAIRADMDALPIMDEKDAPYKSKVPGVAHLCGHDAHMTILLGAIAVLDQYELEEGNIVYIFQPAEEGYAGAKHMVEEGVLKNPDVDTIIGLHVHPTAPVGKTTVTLEFATACTDAFDLEISGRGGHAAHPHQAVDSITITGEIITSLQQVVSRVVDPLELRLERLREATRATSLHRPSN